MTIPESLRTLAASHGGMFTTQQAFAHGFSEVALARAVATDAAAHPMRGLYCLAHPGECTPLDWHQRLCLGAHLLYPDLVLTSISAVLAHGIPVWNVDLSKPIIRRQVDRGRGTRGIRVRRGASASVSTSWGPAVPLATALVELAMDAGMPAGVVSADAALHQELVTPEQLVAETQERRLWPRIAWATSMTEFVDGRSESVAESRARLILQMHGYELTPQFPIANRHDRVIARVDFRIDGTRVVIEVDGKSKYFNPGDERTPEQVFWAEKRRHDDITALGYLIVRVYWADLEEPRRLLAKVRDALAQAA